MGAFGFEHDATSFSCPLHPTLLSYPAPLILSLPFPLIHLQWDFSQGCRPPWAWERGLFETMCPEVGSLHPPAPAPSPAHSPAHAGFGPTSLYPALPHGRSHLPHAMRTQTWRFAPRVLPRILLDLYEGRMWPAEFNNGC